MTIQQYDDGNGGQVAHPALMGAGDLTATGRAEIAAAIAQIQVKVQVARMFPRDWEITRKRVKSSCDRRSFAEKAFFSYPRGRRFDEETGQWVTNYITGPSIHLARELAAAWQNLDYGIIEVDRDEERHIAVMRAFCRDNELNDETSTTFIVKHVRDKGQGENKTKEPLVDERDIYERNANDGARRMRAMIFGMLPAWYVDMATGWCENTLAKGEPDPKTGEVKPPEVRMAEAVDAFAETYGVRKEQLEAFTGAKFPSWRIHDLTRLIVLYKSLQRGEAQVDDVFPPARVIITDAGAQQPAPAPAREVTGEEPPEPGAAMTPGTLAAVETAFAACGWTGRDESRRVAVAAVLAGVPGEVAGWDGLDEAQARVVLARLREIANGTPAAGRRDVLHKIYSEARAAARKDRLATQAAARAAQQSRNDHGRFTAGDSGDDDPGPEMTGVVVEDPPPDLDEEPGR